jgi:5-(carboxyamino)imidazole ribonucleotide synthase
MPLARDAEATTCSVRTMSDDAHVSMIRVGVVGAGQLARMMGESSHGVGVSVTVLATSIEEAAVATCDNVLVGEARDVAAIERLSEVVDVVTFDHELVDLDQLAQLESRGVLVRPSAKALRFGVDKAHQRRAFLAAGLPVPRFLVVSSSSDHAIEAFVREIQGPLVVKAARGGYDGRGVLFPQGDGEVRTMIDELSGTGDVLLEERLDLHAEVAQVVVRGVDGAHVLYPMVTTVQAKGMCVEVRYPAEVSNELASQGKILATQIASLIDVVGVLAIEFFVTDAGLIINEVALRPHNSAHWTIEGARTSQFANHLLAVSAQPLGSASPLRPYAVMVNLVGAEAPTSLIEALNVEGAFVHDYGKSWRPGRKLGHVTVVGDDARAAHVTAWESARAYGTRTRET